MRLFDASIKIGDLNVEAKEIDLNVEEIKSLLQSGIIENYSTVTTENKRTENTTRHGGSFRSIRERKHPQEEEVTGRDLLDINNMGLGQNNHTEPHVDKYSPHDHDGDVIDLEKIDSIVVPEKEFHKNIEDIFTELREDLLVREIILEKQNYDLTIGLRIDDYEDLNDVVQNQELNELKSYVVDVLVSCINKDAFSVEEYHMYVQIQDSKYDMDHNNMATLLLDILPYDKE